MTAIHADSFDHIVVGAGSAGCVVASRLSADSTARVLLVEAGPDFPPGAEPAVVRDRGARAFMSREYYWPNLFNDGSDRRGPLLQARIVGGGSAINGMHAQRGLPRDYDEWRAFGVEGWSWNDVLPYFNRLEADQDFAGPLHGKDGPIEIRRVPQSQWSNLSLALREALDKRGVPRLEDVNAEDGDGTAPTPLNNCSRARISSAVAYLSANVRSRGNLRILPNAEVARVTLEGRRITGIELAGGTLVRARNVIVCAGAIHSPALLMRSGIGPGGELMEAGIAVIADRPGVGRNLRNHPMLTVTSHISRAGRQNKFRTVRQPVPMIVRYSSGMPDESTDIVLNLWERVPGPLKNDPLGRQLAQIMIILNRSHSQGTVRLNPADPRGPVRINANILADSRDLERMVSSFRMLGEMLSTAPMAQLVNHSFLSNVALGLPPDRLTRMLLRDDLRARMISLAGALAMDYVPGLRGAFLRRAGRDIAPVLAEPRALLDLVRRSTRMGSHPAGTCRLGRTNDPEAVVDSRCRVIGVEGLRVVDASIFPLLMTAGPNLPSIMAGEKAADMIQQDGKQRAQPVVA